MAYPWPRRLLRPDFSLLIYFFFSFPAIQLRGSTACFRCDCFSSASSRADARNRRALTHEHGVFSLFCLLCVREHGRKGGTRNDGWAATRRDVIKRGSLPGEPAGSAGRRRRAPHACRRGTRRRADEKTKNKGKENGATTRARGRASAHREGIVMKLARLPRAHGRGRGTGARRRRRRTTTATSTGRLYWITSTLSLYFSPPSRTCFARSLHFS